MFIHALFTCRSDNSEHLHFAPPGIVTTICKYWKKIIHFFNFLSEYLVIYFIALYIGIYFIVHLYSFYILYILALFFILLC